MNWSSLLSYRCRCTANLAVRPTPGVLLCAACAATTARAAAAARLTRRRTAARQEPPGIPEIARHTAHLSPAS